jgi:integrase
MIRGCPDPDRDEEAACDPAPPRPHPAVHPQPAPGLRAAVAAAGEDLARLDLRGPHDLRHTFATWLEDAGIPSRVIDELMGHTGGRRAGGTGGSPMGRVYRETTPAMLARVTAVLNERIDRAVMAAASVQRDAREPTGAEAG